MKIKVVFFVTACKKSGPIQQTLNIIKFLDKEKVEPILLTIYPEAEDGSSQIDKFLPLVKHYYVPTSKLNILTGTDNALRKKLKEINPDVIHTLGAFPNYAIAKIKKYHQIITLRNYIYSDGFDKYGYWKSMLAAKMNLYAMKHASLTLTCSDSLSRIYAEKLNLHFDHIANGVDLDNYNPASKEEKMLLRQKLNLPADQFVFVYAGQVIQRKNQSFLLEAFSNRLQGQGIHLTILGDGVMFNELKEKYGEVAGIDFRGNVLNVNEYLKAADAYVSTSISEGMPNGVLEAMASGLPYVLSNIEQHLEVYNAEKSCGFVYKQGNADDLATQMMKLARENSHEMGIIAADVAKTTFSAYINSARYQEKYISVSRKA